MVPMDKHILDEFARMVLEIPVPEITVAALCRRAGCNKTTFYYHYAAFDDLVDHYLEEIDAEGLLGQALGALLEQHAESEADTSPSADRSAGPSARDGLPEGDLSALAHKYDLLCTLAALNPQGIMARRIREILREHAALTLGATDKPTMRKEMLVEVASGSFMSLLAYRGRTGNAVGFDEMTATFYPDVIPALIRAAQQ